MQTGRKWISPRFACLFLFVFPLISSPNIFANEPVGSIQVFTEEVVPGKEIQIRLAITHSANSFLHHVEWVDLVVNEQQSNHWAYSAFDLPPAEAFQKVVKYGVPNSQEVRIVAEAFCIRHGSSGKISLRIPVKI